ncbi:MAG: beta-N-acetylhexosaminidase [Gammaproteobacteria bacterium]
MPKALAPGPLVIGLSGPRLTPADAQLLLHPSIGGVILFERNFVDADQLRALCAEIHALREPRLLIAVDQEGGRVQRLRPGFTPLPPAAAYGRAYAEDAARGLALARAGGLVMAAELVALGIDLSFAPVLDLDYGVSEIIGARAFHAQPQAAAALAGAFMAGMAEAGMAACGKHFPGHGAVAADTHLTQVIDRRSRAAIEADLLPYRRLIPEGLSSVMMAHVVFPAVDAEPAGFSRRWVQEVLRGELGFGGAVFSDDLGMAGAAGAGGFVERARRALAAGCDYLLICNDLDAVNATLVALSPAAVPLPRHLALLARPVGQVHGQLGAARQALAGCPA